MRSSSGVTLKNAALRGLPDNEPLIEISALHVDILWREVWKSRTAVTRWLSQSRMP